MAYAPPQQNVNHGEGGAVVSDKIEVFISCRNLPKTLSNSRSDPFAVILQKNEKNGKFFELAKTEIVHDNNNPDFTKQITIDYTFEEVQVIRLDIYDADSPNIDNLSAHKFVGGCEFLLGDLVTSKSNKFAMTIKNKAGKLLSVDTVPCACIVRSEEVKQNHDRLLIQFQARNLPEMGWVGQKVKPNPYLQLYRQAPDGGWMSVMRTKTLKKTADPVWGKVTIPIQRLCNGDYSRPILIRCFHDKEHEEPAEIGECQTTLQKLIDEESKPLLTRDTATNAGTISFPLREVVKKHGFLEYVMGGMQIQMIVAIDFTGSNGDPSDPKSLHYVGEPKHESPYMRAIRSVGRVIEPYDSDGMIAAYGFGADTNPRGEKKVSHCFNLTLTDQHEVSGIDGVLETYKQCLSKILLYGPTYFNEVVATAAKAAASMENNEKEQNYVILMIITDGEINDMHETTDEIVAATELPLSIIIVGVGSANFSAMDQLDADDVPLRSSMGVVMKRDIVQFVPFNKFRNGHIGDLAKAVLEEVPDQITSFMSMKGLQPLRSSEGVNADDGSPTTSNMYEGPSRLVRGRTPDLLNDDEKNNDNQISKRQKQSIAGKKRTRMSDEGEDEHEPPTKKQKSKEEMSEPKLTYYGCYQWALKRCRHANYVKSATTLKELVAARQDEVDSFAMDIEEFSCRFCEKAVELDDKVYLCDVCQHWITMVHEACLKKMDSSNKELGVVNNNCYEDYVTRYATPSGWKCTRRTLERNSQETKTK